MQVRDCVAGEPQRHRSAKERQGRQVSILHSPSIDDVGLEPGNTDKESVDLRLFNINKLINFLDLGFLYNPCQ